MTAAAIARAVGLAALALLVASATGLAADIYPSRPVRLIVPFNSEISRALKEPDLIAKFAQQGITPAGGTPADFQRTIAADLKTWTEIARAANIKAE
jgi:tripartite-type tricarboxylate transporter receptor subunit TctC